MSEPKDLVMLSAGDETEDLLKFIFRALPDEVLDQIELDRVTPEGGPVARELITTAAILSFTSAIAIPVFNLIGKWMEQKRQERALQLIYQASKEDKEIMRTLATLEKQHAQLAVKQGAIGARLLKGRGTP